MDFKINSIANYCCDFDSQIAYIINNYDEQPIESITIREYLKNKQSYH